MTKLSRRQFAAAGASLAVAAPAKAAPTLTVRQVLDRMRGQIGTEWFERGVDRIVAGDPDTVVTGIGTTMMGTFDAMKAAAAAKCNLVITHEPSFWSHQDTVTQFQDDPLYKVKLAYMKAHNLAAFHFHDHWHAKKPVDGIHQGMAGRMGWSRYLKNPYDRHIDLPPTTLGGLAREFQKKLDNRTLRVIGDPDLPVKRIAVSWGYCSMLPGAPILAGDCDTLVIGECQDWDLIAYAQDLVASGRKKGLIVLGHILSEQWGMEYAVPWLKTFVPEVPVKFLRLAEPYWNLKNPVFEINTRGVAVSDLTALQLIQRVIAQSGAPNRPQTVDHVSAGDPTQAVSGIAVMVQATLDGLRQAANAKANLVFTYDPAFWATGDDLTRMETDALFLEKRDFIRAHNLVVFNLHDHLRDSMPDRIAAGMGQALGWQSDPGNINLFRRPPTTLLALAQELGARLDDKSLRVVGDPKLPVASVAASFGNTQQMPGIALLNSPIDVLVCGYAREWEVVEYAQDMISAGLKKAVVLLGENSSVQAGMKFSADWIKTVVTEVPVTFIPLPEPYWSL